MGKKPRPAVAHGLLLVDKPKGWTSHDVVAKMRRVVGQRQVGHTGTLDPMATGLLALPLGRATRLARFIEATEKEYTGTVTLGRSTTTWDAEGETVDESDVPELTLEAVQAAVGSLSGELEIEVPAFSAVKVDGQRLYAKARRGEKVEAPRRVIEVTKIEVLNFDGENNVELACTVSKGTYIRSLAVMLGARLNLPAHLSALRRTRVGAFTVDSAVTPEIEALPEGAVIPPAAAVGHLPAVTVDARGEKDVSHGRPLSVGQCGDRYAAGTSVRILSQEGRLLAMGQWSDETNQPSARAVDYLCVLASS